MKVSIITVTFNRGYIIKYAIESVLKQKSKDYEYIIVDGASNDNTIEILKEYEPKFEGRMKWISELDNGLYDAINKGIKMASGDVVGIINSDDFFHRDDIFLRVADAFDNNDIDAIYAQERVVKPNNINENYRFVTSWYFTPGGFRFGLMPSHPTFYAKRELFDKFGYYKTDYVIAADFELMLRFIYKHKIRTKYLRFPLLTFREGGVSTIASHRMLNNREQLRACRENGVWSCIPMIFCKYPFKIIELLIGKNKK